MVAIEDGGDDRFDRILRRVVPSAVSDGGRDRKHPEERANDGGDELFEAEACRRVALTDQLVDRYATDAGFGMSERWRQSSPALQKDTCQQRSRSMVHQERARRPPRDDSVRSSPPDIWSSASNTSI